MEMWLRTSGKEMLFPIMPSSFNLEGSSTIHTSTVVKLAPFVLAFSLCKIRNPVRSVSSLNTTTRFGEIAV